ncbi:MAG: leucine-rich repeat domain-containing protein, partial [Alistipes sp.]|nr:leucine-rich repeat domain-containing protein [Alistipes sp.]
MKKLIFCLAVLGAVLAGCSANDDDTGGNGGSKNPELPKLPTLPDPNDVCSCMDDIVFMQYCYDNFDVNHDGAVSPTEVAAVTEIILGDENSTNALPVKSLTGIGYFTNLELLNCRNCSQLQSVDLRRNRKLKLPQLDSNEGSNGCFSRCSALSEIFLPDNILSIGGSTFYGCSSLTSINIPDGVTEIGYSAFYGCSSLTSINIPDGVTTIGNYAFKNCSGLTSINIPDGVTEIGYSAFYGCSSLTSI